MAGRTVINIEMIGEGKPLVLFHGWGFDHRIWLPLASAIKTRFKLFLVDLPGFGKSSLCSWFQFKNMLLKQLPSQFDLLGWSLGGLYAMRLAIEHPQKVQQLINVATTPKFTEDINWPGIKPFHLNQYFEQLKQNPEDVLRDFIALQTNNSIEVPLSPINQIALSASLECLATWDLRAKLNKLAKTTTFLFGRLDKITPAATLTTMQTKYPQFHYVLFKKAAHMPFLSHEAEFIDFLKDRL